MEAASLQTSVHSSIADRWALRRSVRCGGFELAAGAIGRIVERDGPIVRMSGGVDVRIDPGDLAPITVDGELPRDGAFALLLVAVVGSRAHGLADDDSDIDRRGFYVPAARAHFSLDGAPAQLVHDDDQLCFWEVGKFVRLALAANPTVLEMLYSPVIEFVSPRVAAPLESG